MQLMSAAFARNLSALLGARKAGDPLPTRLQIFKCGQNDSNQGIFNVDDKTIASLAANQRLLGRERVPIGFEHNIDEGSEEYKRTQEPRPIAAMATVEAVPGQGIFLSAIDWKNAGIDALEHYEDLSPTPIFDKKSRRVLAIGSVSLTRAGSMYGLTLENAAAAKLSASLNPTATEPEETMSEQTISVAELAAALKLPATAGKSETLTALARLSAPPTIKLKIGDTEQELDMTQLATRVIGIEASLASERSKTTSAERGTLIARLASEGKAPMDPDTGKPFSAEQLGKFDAPTLRLLVSNTPATVPLASRARLNTENPTALDPALKGSARIMAAFDRENNMRASVAA